jgi:hypothetical protein
MLHRQPTVEEMRSALEEAAKVPPLERFNRMVRRGLINKEGRLTRLYGGAAEPEPEALEYLRPPQENSRSE